MKKKVVEVAVFRTPDGFVEAHFTRTWGYDGVSVRTYAALTSASIWRISIAANRAGGRIYAEALQSGVGFRMVR